MHLFMKLLEATFKKSNPKQHLHDLRYRYRCATVIQFKLVKKSTGHQKIIFLCFFLAKLFTYSAMSNVEA